jgi:hypothetical protein
LLARQSVLLGLAGDAAEQRTQLDDAAVRDCMKTKGYKIETEGR